MKWLKGLLLISFSFIWFGCKKNIKPDYPSEIRCERFSGVYKMYDPINDVNYLMTCDCLPNTEVNARDSLIFHNYANLIHYTREIKPYSEAPYYLGINIIDPIMDKNGNRWVFTNGGGGYSGENYRKNALIGDSLYITFELSNYPYYVEDDELPLATGETTHFGVKIH